MNTALDNFISSIPIEVNASKYYKYMLISLFMTRYQAELDTAMEL